MVRNTMVVELLVDGIKVKELSAQLRLIFGLRPLNFFHFQLFSKRMHQSGFLFFLIYLIIDLRFQLLLLDIVHLSLSEEGVLLGGHLAANAPVSTVLVIF